MSFQQGLSGLNATSKNLQIIGNNIANANTFGSKAARAEFSDMYANALSGAGSTSNIGIGTMLTSVAQQFTQGTIKTTERPMDLAINGGGFFQVTDGKSPITFSRNGQFEVDRDGFIVNNALQKLMGYAADAQGQIQAGQAAPLQLPTGSVAPTATSKIAFDMNLASGEAVTVPASGAQIDFNDVTTFNHATSVTVFDAKGEQVALGYYFQKTATDTWDVYATANGTTIGGVAGAPLPITTVQFAADGSAPISPTGPVSFTVPATLTSTGAATLAISNVLLDLSNSTQYASAYGVTDASQDGFGSGKLTEIAVEANGIITVHYSNNQTRPVGQIELANFRNPQGLQPIGDNAWSRTFASGDPVMGVPGDGNLGVLNAGALEESNVDLTGELVNMIVAQRFYQANAQTIKTEDQILQTLVNIR